jgi:hypothetical protein
MRANPKVTLMKDRSNTFPITHFYPKSLLFNKTASIIDPTTGSVLAVLLKKIVPEPLLMLIEKITATHREVVERKIKVEDMKGKCLSTKFGSYIEYGGSGATWTVKERDYYPNFLQDIDAVGIWMNKIFKYMCPEIEARVAKFPAHMRLWDTTSLLFWNASNIQHRYVDIRDFMYSIVLSFGHYKNSYIELYYLNTLLQVEQRDMYLLNAYKVYHNIVELDPKRQSLIFVNHTCVLDRYSPKANANLYDSVYKNE